MSNTVIILTDDKAAFRSSLFNQYGLSLEELSYVSAKREEFRIRNIGLVILSVNSDNSQQALEFADKLTFEDKIPLLFLCSTADLDVMDKAMKIPNYGFVLQDSGDIALLAAVRTALKLIAREKTEHTYNRVLAKKNLEEIDQKYTNLFNSMLEAFALHEIICGKEGTPVDYRFLEVNPAFERLTGLKKGDVIGKTVLELLPETEPLWIENYGKETTIGESATIRGYSKAVGRYYHVNSFKQKRKQFVVLFTDVTELQNAEAKIKESEGKYRLLAENTTDVIWTTDLDLNLSYISPSIEKMTGFSPEEYRKIPITKKHPSSSLEIISALLEEEMIIEQDPNRDLRRNRYIEIEHYVFDGSTRWAGLNVTAIRDENGKMIGFQGVSRDISKQKKAEKELRESEEFIRTVLDNMPIGIAVNSVYPEVKFSYMNDKFPEIYRTTRQKLQAPNSFWKAVYHDTKFREDLKKRILDDCASGDPQRMRWDDIPVTRQGEETSYISAQNTPVPNQPLQISTVIDITDRKKAEKELRESEERLKTLIANSPVVIYSYKIINGKCEFTYFSDTVKEILGYEPEEMISKTDSPENYIHPDDLDFIVLNDKELTTKEPGLMPVIEFKHKHKNGKYRWLSDRQRVVSNKDGVVEVVGSFTDITEIKEYQQKLKETINDFYRLSEQSRSYTWSVDKTGTYTSVGEIAKLVLDYEPAEMIGKKVWDFHPLDGRDIFKQEIFIRLEKPVANVNYENPMINKKGETVWVTTTAVPKFDKENKHIGFQGIDTDITERKQAEEVRVSLQIKLLQSQKMESIGKLAGGIAHDFKNSLAVITGLAELSMMLMDEISPAYKKIQDIIEACQKTNKLIQQLLAFARKQPINPQIVNVNDVIGEMVDILAHSIGKNIKIKFNSDSELWKILIDPSQVDQIVMNFCVNARDAILGDNQTKNGTIDIDTRNVANIEDVLTIPELDLIPGNYVLIKISDNGSGMDSETLSRIYEPFFTTKEEGKGTGLGLATVYGIVKQNNGYITVESELGEGTTFFVYLPKADGEVPESNDSEEDDWNI